MNPFELITDDEVLYQMCQKWGTSTLLNMSEVYKRVRVVCNNEIKRRKMDAIRKTVSELGLTGENRSVYFRHQNYDENRILIQKTQKGWGFYQFGFPITLPWVLEGIKDNTIVNMSYYTNLSNEEELQKAVNALKRSGFVQVDS